MTLRFGLSLLLALPLELALGQDTLPPTMTNPKFSFIAATGFARENAIGYHGLIGVETRTPSRHLRLRAEGLITDFGRFGQTNTVLGVTTITSLLTRPATPYLLAGAATAQNGGFQRGWSLGLGWRFPLGQRIMFVESRMYSIHNPRRSGLIGNEWRYLYTPVSLGLRF